MREPPAVAQRGLKNPPGRADVSASRPGTTKRPEFTFEREDWTLFRSLATLGQKAGVPVHLLPKLVLKELADNALDAGATVRVGQLEDGGWYMDDDGPGIAGDPTEIARLFSIRGPLVSSKLLRLPTRGALGNGLRVVAGAVLASGGRLVVATRGRRIDLRPQGPEPVLVQPVHPRGRRQGRASRAACRAAEPRHKRSQKEVVLAHLDTAIAKASGHGAYRFSPRQVFYVIRPPVRDAVGAELQWGNFETIIGDYELQHGEVAGMYRDPRGTLYHPHRRDSIPLGTLQVERYQRPEWTFNKILFIEKEGFFEALKEAAWPERHDCALLTSKGQPTRAARDLLDLLGETGEEILFFAVHDADAAGTLIYQSLQDATRARPERKVRVVNLGLEPEEALAMELEVEDVEPGERRKPLASYVPDVWQDWLQYHRVELNAMTTPQFISWLDAKMAAFGNGKLVPPGAVLMNDLSDALEHRLHRQITEQILRDAGIEQRVAAALQKIDLPLPEDLHAVVDDALADAPAGCWRAAIAQLADQLLAAQRRPDAPPERGA